MNKYIKLALGIILVVFGIYLIWNRDYGWGFTVLFFSIFPIIFFFRNEFIFLSFWQIRKENLPKARFWLDKIKNPSSQLVRKQLGYYNYLLGITEGQTNVSAAEKYMKTALNYGLSFKHDRAMANLSLAGSALTKGRKKEAETYLREAKKLDTNNMFAEHIKMMQEQMKRVNIGRNLHNPNMRRRGKF